MHWNITILHAVRVKCPTDLPGYREACQSRRKLDFDDMILYCYELFVQRKDILEAWQKKFQYILVDEFQDINQLQYDIVRMLAKPQNNLFIVGDDDQSIYHFRGARPEIMLNFTRDYPDAGNSYTGCELSMQWTDPFSSDARDQEKIKNVFPKSFPHRIR